MTDAARDDQINAIVNQLANDAARRCGDDPDIVICAVSGLFAHMISSFGIPNDRAHVMLAELLAQHEGAVTMTDAPERIWLLPHDGEQRCWCTDPDPSGSGHGDEATAYVRADLVEALEAESLRLRGALEQIAIQKRTDELVTVYDVEFADFEDGYDQCIDCARAALRSTEASHG